MLTAIIVDDEPKVCALIRQLGDWERLGIEVKAVCGDGEEALRLITELSPNIVITDIRMPVIDGLELVNRTRAMGLDTSFVIISGYRHFEYAYNALQFGVASYMLKPIDKIQLNTTLEKICDDISKRDMQKSDNAQLAQMQQEKQNLRNERFILALLDSDEATVSALETVISLPQADGFAMIVNTSFPQLHDSTSVFGTMVEERAQKAFAKCGRILSVTTSSGIICLLMLNDGCDTGLVQRSKNLLWGEICSLRDIFGDFQLAIGVGDIQPCPKGFAESLREARQRERLKIVRGWNRVLDSGGIRERPDLFAFQARIQNLLSSLDTLNEEAVHKWFCEWRSGTVLDVSDDGVLRLYEERDALLKRCASVDIALDNVSITMNTDRASDASDLIDQIESAFTESLQRRLIAVSQEESRPVRDARAYVKRHYAKNLSLETVAAEIGYNPVYFSKLYKKLTGQGFAEYVTDVRIAEAKTLLKNTRMSILEISTAIGYLDDKYFRKLFKRITGISPKAYRKLYE